MFAHRLTTYLLVLAALGCQTESETISPSEVSSFDTQQTSVMAENVRLKQMIVTGENGGLGPMFTTAYFTYSQGHELSKVVIPSSTMAGSWTYLYTYDEQDRIKSYRMLREHPTNNGNMGQQVNYSYNNGEILETSVQVQTDGQLIPYSIEPNLRTFYHFNDQGQVTELFQEGVVRFGAETSQRVLYTYENGNIVKVTMINGENQVESVITYEYDDKVNPFYKGTHMPYSELNSSRNNIVSAQVNDNEPQRKEYTYNEQGLPLTQKYVSTGAVLTYEYESFKNQ